MTADDMSCRLGRGISLGNALDTLREGDAGFRLRDQYFADIRDAGFETVRLPVKWSAHASVRLEAERLGLSWCYWDFGTDFGAFDPRRNAWREPVRDALLGNASPSAG
jgi:aryl-phospho-beta-D-glucosidase BglC (GH1 family)